MRNRTEIVRKGQGKRWKTEGSASVAKTLVAYGWLTFCVAYFWAVTSNVLSHTHTAALSHAHKFNV